MVLNLADLKRIRTNFQYKNMKPETRQKSRGKFQENSVIGNRKLPESDPRAGIWSLKLPEVSRNRRRAGIWILELPEVSRASWHLEPETSGSFQKQTPCWNLEPGTAGSFQNVVSGNLKFEIVDNIDARRLEIASCRRVCLPAPPPPQQLRLAAAS